MFWDALGAIVIAAHYAFMAYLVVGGFIAWRWRWTIATHLLAVAWAVLIVAFHWDCPLTWAQNHLRVLAGRAPLPNSFINLYIQGTFYPHGAQTYAQIALGVVVIVSWVGFWRLRHRKKPRIARPASTNAATGTAGPARAHQLPS